MKRIDWRQCCDRIRPGVLAISARASGSRMIAVLSSLVIAAILAFPLYGSGFDSFVVFGDEADSNLPQLMHLKQMVLEQGVSSWWYNSVCGTDYFGSAVAIKSNLLMFLLLPNYIAYLLFRYFAYAIGIYSTYILMRGYFKTNGIVSLSTGALFMSIQICDPLLGHGWSMSLLPLVLYYFCRVDKTSTRTMLLASLYGFLFGLTGHFTQTFYMLYFIVLFCVIFRIKEMRVWLLHLLAFSAMHVISQVPDMIAAFSVAGVSHRSEDLYVAVRDSVFSPAALNAQRANLMTYMINLRTVIMAPGGLVCRHLFLILSFAGLFYTKSHSRRILMRLLLVYFAMLYADAFTVDIVQRVLGVLLSADETRSRLMASGIDSRLWMMKPLIESIMMVVSIGYIVDYLKSVPDVRRTCIGQEGSGKPIS